MSLLLGVLRIDFCFFSSLRADNGSTRCFDVFGGSRIPVESAISIPKRTCCFGVVLYFLTSPLNSGANPLECLFLFKTLRSSLVRPGVFELCSLADSFEFFALTASKHVELLSLSSSCSDSPDRFTISLDVDDCTDRF